MTPSQALAHPMPPAPRVPSEPPVSTSTVRLSLAPPRSSVSPVDGAWWPRSTDATTELPGLVSAVDQRLKERTLRIGLHVDAWDNIPRRLSAPGRAVRVGWFRAMDPRLVTLSLGGGKIITLRVIPPAASPDVARSEFAAAIGNVSDQPAANAARIATPEEDPGRDNWENEGGSSPSPGMKNVPDDTR
ncbi:DUF5994 family protein [Nonomuraea endophytica]|uniref:DUF5994 family protein n=1 Tax=Nonomuraea endophytica TaxID=714136 RepID=UPI0037C889E9